MSLSSAQKHEALFYLGYPGKILLEGSTHYNSVIADRLDNLNTFIESQVDDLLDEVKAIRKLLVASQKRMAVSQVDEITFNNDEHYMLQREHNRLLSDLGKLLDIKPAKGGSTISVCV